MSDLGKILAPLARRLGNMLARGSVAAANGTGKMRTLQIRMMADETKDNVEHFEPYGFTSEVMPGSEPIAAFFDGDRSHGVVLVVADRRYRLTGMKSGEVALYDDQGQKVYLTRTGIVIHSAQKVRVEAADIELHASHSYSWDVNGFGERWTWTGGSSWQHKTWRTGATVSNITQSINPPEGP